MGETARVELEDGSSLSIEIFVEEKVKDMKKKIEKITRIPASSQILMIGEVALGDEQDGFNLRNSRLQLRREIPFPFRAELFFKFPTSHYPLRMIVNLTHSVRHLKHQLLTSQCP